MDNKRGFITVATGDYYCWLAENLVMSYKLFSDTKYPMFVMTDKKGEKRLKKYFDGVIVLEKPYYTFMDKMMVYQNSPFEETIFLDADSNIVSDISFLFDDFAANGSYLSCVGSLRKITETVRPNHFGDYVINQFGLKNYVAFNGGVYYFKKSQECADCLERIFSDLIPNYKKYKLKEFRSGQMADEPLYGLSMLICGFFPLDTTYDIMSQVQDMNNLNWNQVNRKCSFVKYGCIVCPVILHYGTHNTYTKKYVYYNTLVRYKYNNLPTVFLPFQLLSSEIRLLFWHIANPRDRASFWKWVKSHFTKEHIRYRRKQIVSLFNKMPGK